MFESMEIDVVEESPEDADAAFEEDEEEDEKEGYEPGAGDLDDPIKIYFREMGEKALLDREGEIRLARAIEEGLEGRVAAVLNCPMASEYLVELALHVYVEPADMDRLSDKYDDVDPPRAIREVRKIVNAVEKHRKALRKVRSKLKRKLREETALRVRLDIIQVQSKIAAKIAELVPSERFIDESIVRMRRLAANYAIAVRAKDEERIKELEGTHALTQAELRRYLRAIEEAEQQVEWAKSELTQANLRLVVSIAKRHFRPNTNFFEMVSDGNMSSRTA